MSQTAGPSKLQSRMLLHLSTAVTVTLQVSLPAAEAASTAVGRIAADTTLRPSSEYSRPTVGLLPSPAVSWSPSPTVLRSSSITLTHWSVGDIDELPTAAAAATAATAAGERDGGLRPAMFNHDVKLPLAESLATSLCYTQPHVN